MPTLYLSSGDVVSLGPKLGEGGEGAVYEIAGHEGFVAKLYHGHIDALKVRKLSAMATGVSQELLRIAAWPVDTVRTDKYGAIRGIVMPRIVNYSEAHSLYSPKQRQNEFPNADWRFLIWAACNAARAMETVHAAGHVVGDVNQKNFMVGRDATVRLIDCDSFQITSNGETYYCPVGVPEFTPPELQGQRFDATARTPNHDNFGLAVLIFHLLFMGRHPFAGRYHGPGDMPPDRAIRELRFAYSQTAATKHMVPPPHALALSATSFEVAGLFERAFGTAGFHGNRPVAREWVRALEALNHELKKCVTAPAHVYNKALGECPWCAIERGGGPAFFITVGVAGATGASTFDLAGTWAAITRVQAPRPAPSGEPSISTGSCVPAEVPAELRSVRRIANYCAGLGGLALILALFGVWTPVFWFVAIGFGLAWGNIGKAEQWKAERAQRERSLASAQRNWEVFVGAWRANINAATIQFTHLRRELEQLYNEYKGLPVAAQREREALVRNRETLQRKAFLERQYIRHAKLPGIGDGLKATLQSYGVETAFDITPNIRVQGIGDARLSTLLAWRGLIEAGFRFNPNQQVSASEFAAVDSKFARRRKEIERRLLQGPEELRRVYANSEQLHAPSRQLLEAARTLAQARADMQVI